MASDNKNGVDSGQSSPGYPKTMSTGGRPRSDSDTTVITEVTQDTVESNRSINYPNPPINTPYTRSEIGGMDLMDDLSARVEKMNANLDDLIARLGQMNDESPPSSVNDVKGKHDIVLISSASSGHSPASMFEIASSEQPPLTSTPTVALCNDAIKVCNDAMEEHGLATPTPDHHTKNDYFGDGPVFPEASAWEGFAEEDVEKGLQRLAMLAKDLHKVDNSKTAEQHYSERLSKILKEAEFQFDASKLK
ncbi:hypothetical protein KC363_g4767 [Hortaea werneckii]|uniref:Uncharacterized protein n=1 Tax=Hortaea werneckii TaxID=91943 RepID=A0A3M7FPN4_HORWE|nr:hypothetical protein KC361_g4588 [Hortaea werneckii]KAI6883667.1 hypothetical protein KC325_g4894 [Hortaea werneckii]KAI6992634.1 hypothetical protein KC359_g5581 [Hortaea werneckii]KAI7086665.1 hypothetical protein KC356_g4855 [Hortaea werneckii]KAI7145081.1 hypothetical protein KC344_g4820 [Hortaea werneckii]